MKRDYYISVKARVHWSNEDAQPFGKYIAALDPVRLGASAFFHGILSVHCRLHLFSL